MKKILTFILSTLIIFSCSEDDLEITPQQSLSDQTAFSDAAAAEGVLIGTYNLLQDLHTFGSQPQVAADFQSDNVNFVGTFTTLQDMNTFSVTADNGGVNEIWRDTYEAILATNAIITNVPNIEDPALTDEFRDQLIGEAKFIRALCYFLLINKYAQPFQLNGGSNLGVPLVLEPFTGEILLPERASVNAVHAQIADDLESVRTLLPPVIEQGRASSVAATALLSRLRLYREEWQQAADLAEEVINSPDYSLAPDFSFYNNISPELIFTIENIDIDFENQADLESGAGSWDGYYEGSDKSGRGDAPFSQNLTDAFMEEPGDLRFDLKETELTFSGIPAEFTNKYNDGTTNTSDPALIRFTEMLLNRAEALAELNGINAESIDLMNQIRSRAGLPEWTLGTFSSAAEFLDDIATERRKELAFEGHRRMDLLRRNQPLRTVDSVPEGVVGNPGVGVGVGDDQAIFPIPSREIDLNPNLEQNPGF